MAAMDYADMLELIQAARDGKVIQFLDPNGRWTDIVHPCFDHKPLRQPGTGEPNYRIKPAVRKPQEIWVNENAARPHYGYWNKEAAEREKGSLRTAVHYREILPEVDKLVVEALKAVAKIEMEVKATDLVDDVTFSQVMAKKALEALGHGS